MVEVEPALAVSDDDIPADWDVEDSTIGIAVLVSTSSVVVDTGTSVEGDSVVLPQHPFFNGRQLVQDRPDFTDVMSCVNLFNDSFYRLTIKQKNCDGSRSDVTAVMSTAPQHGRGPSDLHIHTKLPVPLDLSINLGGCTGMM